VAWQGIWHRCYRDSLAASATVAALQTLHRLLGTWSRAVDQYIALSEFSRRTLIKCGLPAERISVKPNFLADPPPVALPDWLSSSERHVAGPRLPQSAEASAQDRVRGPHAVGDYALFAGRLSSEKGVDVLLRAWPHVAGRLPLKIAGDGPLAGQVREAAGSHGIEWLGEQPHQNVLTLLGKARCLIVPSTCFENFPRTIVESFAVGTPVIASRLGAMAELVTPGRNGWLFTSGSETELAAQVRAAVDTPLSVMRELRQNCRHEFEERYTPQVNYRLLMEIYRRAGVKRAEDPREQPHASLAMAEPRTAVGTEASLERTLPPRVAAHCGTDAPTHREEPCIS
jgi:glycosyltransferase involved in cell wall biosynthesis